MLQDTANSSQQPTQSPSQTMPPEWQQPPSQPLPYSPYAQPSPQYPPSQPPMQQPPQFQKTRKPLRRSMKMGCGAVAAIVVLVAIIAIATAGGSKGSTPTTNTQATQAPTQQSQPTITPQPTQAPTAQPTQAPTQQLAPLPSASELNQLIDQRDGQVTNVNVTKNADGTSNVAVDIQVKSPTQTRVKHIAYGLAQFFFGERPDVEAINLAFHADGYTGMDDPIANFAGVVSEYKLGYDESQLWDVMGVFDADLSA